MFIDSLNDKLILNFNTGNNICNTDFKGIISFDGHGFGNMDGGFDRFDTINKNTSTISLNCITFDNKTLYGGFFYTVGFNKTKSQSLGLWDGSKWDTFPQHAYNFRYISPPIVYGFFKDNGKLWIYGLFDTIGNQPMNNLCYYDGTGFTRVDLPVNMNHSVTKMVSYKNEIYVIGNFYNLPHDNFSKILKYSNGTWSNVGNGVQGTFGIAYDLLVYNDTLYIAGSYGKQDGNVGNYIMKWDGNQLYDGGFGDFTDWGRITSLLNYKNRMYAFGSFIYCSGKKAFGAAYYESGKWTVNPDSIDNALAGGVIYKNEIYIGGGFSSINGDTSLKHFVKLKCPDFNNCKTDGTGYIEASIFPNPSSNILNIIPGTDFASSGRLTIHDNLGRLIYESSSITTNSMIDVSSWATGIYFLNLNNGNKNKSFKFLKE